MPQIGTAGRKGDNVRSDCQVSFEPRDTGGCEISVRSKVESMYGDAIRRQVDEVLRGLQIENCRLELEDYGALPFTISARIETAVRRAGFNPPEYLPEMKDYCNYTTSRERFRRSRLYLPGNEPKFFINAGLHKPDGVILDLEDAVAPFEKDAARMLVRNALRQVNFYGAERMVRINQGQRGLDDLDWIIPHNVHVVLIPKVEAPEQVKAVDDNIQKIRKERSIEPQVYLMPIIESALGGIKAYEIAIASKNTVSLALGLEDYTADIGTQRTLEGKESFWLRSVIVNAARAAGIQPIDTVFSDVADMEGLKQSVVEAKSLGFDGKGCIHPRQISVIHETFAPEAKEIEKAVKIVTAFQKAEKEGLGVVSLGSKMIDPPVVKRALRTVKMAEILGKLPKGWRDQ
ncbi:HpcH/HpaI aldolase/citrate lyase family protein [bacterium]|nr:HpcH/HpaI aldolase/citrate lyase family protein [bacterium]